jgi:hypothetical protein
MNKYINDVSIDTSALDVEWLAQPQLMMEYGQIQADARKEMDEAKESVLVTYSRIEKKIRLDPAAYGLGDKVTEASIRSTIITLKEHREAQSKVINAQHEYSAAQAAVIALEHKKQALENLGRLLGLQYFSGPKIPYDLGREHRKAKNGELGNLAVTITAGKTKKRKRSRNTE